MIDVWKKSSLRTCTVVIVVCAFLFQLSSMVSPGWLVLDIKTNAKTGLTSGGLNTDMEENGFAGGFENDLNAGNMKITASCGIWYLVACVDMDQIAGMSSICKSVSYIEAMDYAIESFSINGNDAGSVSFDLSQVTGLSSIIEFKVETTIAVFACLLGLILLILSTRPYSYSHSYAGLASICLLCSGLVFAVPIGKFIVIQDRLNDPVVYELRESAGVDLDLNFPYSIALGAVGAFLAIVQCLIVMCYLCRNPPMASSQVIRNGAQMQPIPSNTVHGYPYSPPGYTVMVTPSAAPNVVSFPAAMAPGPMVASPQPLPSEFGAKHGLIDNQEVNC